MRDPMELRDLLATVRVRRDSRLPNEAPEPPQALGRNRFAGACLVCGTPVPRGRGWRAYTGGRSVVLCSEHRA